MSPSTHSLETTRRFLSKIGFNGLIGMRLGRVHRDGLTIYCTVRPELLNSAGLLHGGVSATLADAAVGCALFHRFGGERRFTTVELKINYFRPVSEGRLYARSHLVRVGSTVCVGHVKLKDAQKRDVGLAIATYMFVDARKAE